MHGPAAQRARFSSNPPLKLIVIEDEGDPGTINNVGIEVEDTDAVVAATHRLAEQGLPFKVDDSGPGRARHLHAPFILCSLAQPPHIQGH